MFSFYFKIQAYKDTHKVIFFDRNKLLLKIFHRGLVSGYHHNKNGPAVFDLKTKNKIWYLKGKRYKRTTWLKLAKEM